MNLIISQLQEVLHAVDDKNHSKALRICENLKDDLEEILGPHWNIQSEDDQYEDPEMWDYGPIFDDLKRPLELLHSIDMWYIEDEGYDHHDKESMTEVSDIIEKIILNVRG